MASEHTGGGGYPVQNINGMASKLKGIINHSFRGVSTKYLQSFTNWYLLKSRRLNSENFSNVLVQNKDAVDVHKNREAIYKRFIENFSRRTYRCPVKRSFVSKMDLELIDKLNFI
jgi:hypothetical protein